MGPSPGKRPLVDGQGQFGVGTCLQQAASGVVRPRGARQLERPLQGRALSGVSQGLEAGWVPECSSLELGRNTELPRPVAGYPSARPPVGQACPAGQCVIAAVKACVLKALRALEHLVCWGGGGVSPRKRGGLSSQVTSLLAGGRFCADLWVWEQGVREVLIGLWEYIFWLMCEESEAEDIQISETTRS